MVNDLSPPSEAWDTRAIFMELATPCLPELFDDLFTKSDLRLSFEYVHNGLPALNPGKDFTGCASLLRQEAKRVGAIVLNAYKFRYPVNEIGKIHVDTPEDRFRLV